MPEAPLRKLPPAARVGAMATVTVSAFPRLEQSDPQRVLDTPTVELTPAIGLPRTQGDTPISERAAAALIPGAVLRARYVLQEVIGHGGHSTVFRVQDLHRVTSDDSSGAHIALKVLRSTRHASGHAIARLTREFRQMQLLAHPGIARVFDLDCDGDIWFISMELIRGQTLAEWMRSPIGVAQAMQVIGACSEALDYAHSVGIVHGDLKPSNVLRTADGRVKLIDFGSVPAHDSRTNSESDGTHAATPCYASPQVLAGMPAETQDDIFSLACLSYGLLSAGNRPFGDQSSLQAHRARLCPAIIPGMPVERFSALTCGLAGDRARRPATAQEFHRGLAGHDPTRAVRSQRTVSPAGRNARREWRHFSLASITVAALCALILSVPSARRLLAGAGGGAARIAVAATAPAASGQEPAVPEPAAVTRQDASPSSDADAARGVAVRHAPGVVTFESARMVAGSAQSLIAIPLRRLQFTRGPTSVAWEVERGSAQPDLDYQAVKPQLVRFNDGEAVRSLFIPLIRQSITAGPRPPRSFSVALRQVVGGAQLGAVTRVHITIVAPPILSGMSRDVAVTRLPAN